MSYSPQSPFKDTANSTTTPLSGAATYTGTGVLSTRPAIMVQTKSDVSGTLYFDFSVDGTNWDSTYPTAGYACAAGVPEVHTANGATTLRIKAGGNTNDAAAGSGARGITLEGLDENFVQRTMENREKNLANIIIAGVSYGQGSSREHAALCPAYLGVKVVVAKSIERIHRQNLINFGIVPLLFEHESDYDRIAEMDSIEIPEIRSRLAQRSDIVAINNTKHTRIPVRHDLSEREIWILLKGGKLNYYAE